MYKNYMNLRTKTGFLIKNCKAVLGVNDPRARAR